MDPKACLTPNCTGEPRSRGLCIACYEYARNLTLRGFTTWESMERRGICLHESYVPRGRQRKSARRDWFLHGQRNGAAEAPADPSPQSPEPPPQAATLEPQPNPEPPHTEPTEAPPQEPSDFVFLDNKSRPFRVRKDGLVHYLDAWVRSAPDAGRWEPMYGLKPEQVEFFRERALPPDAAAAYQETKNAPEAKTA